LEALGKNDKLLTHAAGAGELLGGLGVSLGGKAPTLGARTQELDNALEEARNPAPLKTGFSELDKAVISTLGQQLIASGIPPEKIREMLPRIQALPPEMKIQYGVPKEMQKDAREALEMSKALDMIPMMKDGDAMTKARVQGAVYGAVSKATRGNTELKKVADKEARKILALGVSDDRKKAMISELLASLDTEGYNRFKEMGVVK
jgi:hypothetical protein